MKNIFVFGITLVLISGIASALPNPASTYCEEMGYQLVGEMCVFPDSTSCEQWAFYRGECGQNYVHGVECAQAGEHSGVAIQCCEGLDEISNSLVGNDGMCAYPIGAYPICSDCGNGICESWENLCSCPEDCLTYPGIYINIDKEKYDINDNMNIVLKTDRKGEWKINVGFYGTESDEIKYIKKGVILSEILELNVKLSDYDDFFKKSGEYGLQTSEHNAVIEGFVNTNSVPFTVNVPGKCFDSDYGKEPYVKGYVILGNEKREDICYIPESVSNDGTTNSGERVDSCRENELCYVTEYFCPDDDSASNAVGTDWIKCTYGCRDGACIRDIEQNLPPVIDDVSAPTVLKVSETGTWTIKAHDPENGVLSYSVDWGEYIIKPDTSTASTTQEISQTATFTHSYSRAGTYTVTVIVTDDHSQTAKTSATVNVEGEANICSERQQIDILAVRNQNGKIAVDYLIGPDYNSVEVWLGHSHGGDLKMCNLDPMGSCSVSSTDPFSKCSLTTDCRYPSDDDTYMVTMHDRKCGLSDIFKFNGIIIQNKYYSHAKWTCYDGVGYSSEDLAIPSVEEPILVSNDVATGYMTVEEVTGTSIEISLRCKSYSEWQQEAEDTCRGHCSKETGKCGVNSFSVWGTCTPPYETCSDSDNGKNYYEKGTTKSGSGKVKTDTCIECVGECQIDGPCSEPYCYKVEEYFCGKSGIESSIYSCPNGCKDGACIALPTSKCNTDADCGEGEKSRYCSGDSACIKSSYPQCVNPGTDKSQCTWIGTGSCTPCPNGCNDGKCISGECGNGICEENEVCDVDCCEYYCQLYCPNGYVEGSCHCKCMEGPDVVCTDSDEGPNYFTPGIAIGPGGSFFSDICDTNGKILQEGICTKDGKVDSIKYECPNGCEKGACIDEGDTTSCSGCSYESACLPIGFRRGTQYCDIDHQLKEQKGGNDACDNHHECTSNVCVSGKCVSPSFIDALISWFTSLFGG